MIVRFFFLIKRKGNHVADLNPEIEMITVCSEKKILK
jgi:hypothetical protein